MVRIFGAELGENRATSTDERGTYEFVDLPAGRYTINASKGGFVTITYGQRRPLEAGRPLQLGENETAERINLSLPRGGVITGRIVDEYGDPVANAMVQAMQFRYMNGQKRPMVSSAPAMTPDNGEFRLWGLSPGEYVLSATLRDSMMMAGASDDGRTGYAPTYYPGTANVAEAQRVTLTVGATLTDVTIGLVLTRTARVSGTAVDAEGQPLSSGFVNLMPKGGQGGMVMMSGGSQVRPDGTFTVSNVVPGTYIVRASAPRGGGPGPVGPFGPPGTASQAEVTVNGQDITGVRLSPVSPVTMRGRIVMDPVLAQTLRPTAVRVMVRPKRPEDMMPMAMGMPEAVKEDATFEMKVNPGSQFIQAMPTGPGGSWQVRSIRVAGVDVTDTGVELTSGSDVDDVEIELTGRVPVVSGTVRNRKGAAATDYTVIAFPQDPAAWTDQAPGRISSTRPDQQGAFQLRTLRPGSYYLVAVEYAEQGQWSDPEYLETLRGRATSLTLAEAETKTVTLTLADEP